MITAMRTLIQGTATAVRFLWYLLLAAILLVGLPWSAVRYVGWPLPRAMPSSTVMRDWIDHPMAGMRFWKGVTVAFWLLWVPTAVLTAWAGLGGDFPGLPPPRT